MTAEFSLDDVQTFPIPDVAAMTNIGKRRILDACRADKLEHVNAGGTRSMTVAQIAAMLRYFSTGATTAPPAPVEPVDPLRQAREKSRRIAARQTPRRAAA